MEILEEFIELHQRGLVTWDEVENVIEGLPISRPRHEKDPVPRRTLHGRFDLVLLSDQDVIHNCRFHREDLVTLQHYLQVGVLLDNNFCCSQNMLCGRLPLNRPPWDQSTAG